MNAFIINAKQITTMTKCATCPNLELGGGTGSRFSRNLGRLCAEAFCFSNKNPIIYYHYYSWVSSSFFNQNDFFVIAINAFKWLYQAS